VVQAVVVLQVAPNFKVESDRMRGTDLLTVVNITAVVLSLTKMDQVDIGIIHLVEEEDGMAAGLAEITISAPVEAALMWQILQVQL
jgi:hypothetical protein